MGKGAGAARREAKVPLLPACQPAAPHSGHLPTAPQRQLEAAGEAPEAAASAAATVVAHQAEEEGGRPALSFQPSQRLAEMARLEER